MASSDSATVLIGVFPDRAPAENFARELRDAGFGQDQVGLLTPGEKPPATFMEESAVAGALSGGTLGALTGAAAATGLLPAVGTVVAAGFLAAVLGGAAVGATAGGLLAVLINLGVPEEEARHYERALHAGRTLVAVKAPGRYAEALAILRRCQEETKPRAEGVVATPEVEQLDELP